MGWRLNQIIMGRAAASPVTIPVSPIRNISSTRMTASRLFCIPTETMTPNSRVRSVVIMITVPKMPNPTIMYRMVMMIIPPAVLTFSCCITSTIISSQRIISYCPSPALLFNEARVALIPSGFVSVIESEVILFSALKNSCAVARFMYTIWLLSWGEGK